MCNGHLFHSLTWIVVPALSLTLTACGGGGNGEPVAEFSSTTTDTLTVHASATGEVTPGLTVTLSAAVEDGGTDISYRWSQTEGLDVDLEDPDKDVTRFRVPSVAEEAELVFAVEATDAAGNSGRYVVSVMVEALTWERLHVVEREVTDQFVVFRADKDIDNRIELYLATLDGESIVRLNDPAPVPRR